MSAAHGVCPHCEATGTVGVACPAELCQRKGYHFIPRLSFQHFTQHSYDDRDPLIGHVIDGYLVAEAIGEGGFGKVYLAMQLPVLMRCALKIMLKKHGDEALTSKMVSRFRGEALSLAKLSHPNIVRLLDTGTYNERPYLIMEYVDEARTLEQEWLRHQQQNTGFATEALRHVFNQVLNALESAHAQQVIHRDLKPENIMLQEVTGDHYFVRILDFGLAKILDRHTQTSMMAGTPVYMAPEQLQATQVGAYTDIYAVGVLLYELATLRTPFIGDTVDAVLAQKLDPARDALNQPHVTNLIRPFREICAHTFSREPEQRFSDIVECREAMNELFDTLMRQGVETLTYKALLESPNEEPPVRVPRTGHTIPPTSGETVIISTLGHQQRGAWWKRPSPWAGIVGVALMIAFLAWPGSVPLAPGGQVPDESYTALQPQHIHTPPAKNRLVVRPDATLMRLPRRKPKRRLKKRDSKPADNLKITPAPKKPKKPSLRPRVQSLRTTRRFSSLFGGKHNDEAYGLTLAGAAEIAVVGASLSRGNGIADLWLLTVNGEGNGVEKSFGGNRADVGLDLARLKDGSYLVVGHTASKGRGQSDAWVLKLNAQGKLIWEVTLGGQFRDQAQRVVPLADGTILVAGTTRSKGAGQNDAWLIKLDANGRELWERTYGTSGNQELSDLVALGDGTLLVVGHTESPETGLDDLWLVKVDAKGQSLWERRIGDPGLSERGVGAVVADATGDLLVAGLRQRSASNKLLDAWMLRIDASGNLRWSRTFGGTGNDVVNQLLRHKTGFVFVGETTLRESGPPVAWLFKLSAKGTPLWEKKFGCRGGCSLRRMVVLPNGDFVAAGYRRPKRGKPKKLWILRLTPHEVP